MGQGPWDQPWGPRERSGRSDRHGRRGGWSGGPPPWVQGLIGLAQSGGAGSPSARGSRVRRGDVRAAILDVLAVEPMNGYQVIQEIAERSGGAWKPSPGSVYPTVQQLEDEGLVEGREGERRRLLQLTEEGRQYVEDHPEELAATWKPFQTTDEHETGDLKPAIGQMMGAVWQIVTSGSRQQQAAASEILDDTRRRLYGLLAEGDPDEDEE
jgi:DNA-binding PadR family transcriptional regulator